MTSQFHEWVEAIESETGATDVTNMTLEQTSKPTHRQKTRKARRHSQQSKTTQRK